MKTIEYRTVDKAGWGPGPWQDEPDKIQWPDAATGLPCLIVRNHHGSLCGYVGVAPGHSLHGKEYMSVDVDVHGGLTFAGSCADHSREAWEKWRMRKNDIEQEALRFPVGNAARYLREYAGCWDSYEAWVARMQESHICHLPEPGEPDCVWWFGFDCGHYTDLSPGMQARMKKLGVGPIPYADDFMEVYKDVAYVKAEVTRLAEQLARIEGARVTAADL